MNKFYVAYYRSSTVASENLIKSPKLKLESHVKLKSIRARGMILVSKSIYSIREIE